MKQKKVKLYASEKKGPLGLPFGLSGSALKWIAIVTMLLDHIGACVIAEYMMNSSGFAAYQGYAGLSYEQKMFWYNAYYVLRYIGRLAFPIFCFLLVEGFSHTRDVKKYALRLGLFCLISEIPFDLAFRGALFNWNYQNVFFTLLLGLLGIWGMEYFKKKGTWPLGVLCMAAAAVAAELLHTDYGAFGVIVIALLYLFHQNRWLQVASGVIAILIYGGMEMWGSLAFLPILLYDGSRGKQPKYFFYIFYPAHLLILTAVGYWILPLVL